MVEQIRESAPPYVVVDPAFESTFAPGTEGESFGTFLDSGAYVEIDADSALTVFVRADLA